MENIFLNNRTTGTFSNYPYLIAKEDMSFQDKGINLYPSTPKESTRAPSMDHTPTNFMSP